MKIVRLDQHHCFNSTIFPKNGVVVKVGVDWLTDLNRMKELYPECIIYAYEADPANYNKWNPLAHSCSLLNLAVGKEGNIRFYRFTNSVSHSIFPRHLKEKNCKLVNEITVKSVPLSFIIKELERIDLLVLNCEGAELLIMEELKKDWIRDKVKQICVSFHDPRIYPTVKKVELINAIGKYYKIIRGHKFQKDSIPDYLFMLK